MNRRTFLKVAGSSLAVGPGAASCSPVRDVGGRPSFLIFLTDDHSWIHAGCYGDAGVRTEAIDRLAGEGVRFEHAYASSSSCVPSRSAILTSQDMWRLEEGGVFGGTLPRKFPVFPLALGAAGYHVGWTGKGWGPGDLKAGGWAEDYPQGKPYNEEVADKGELEALAVSGIDYVRNLEEFLRAREDRPFCFWCGITEPHAPYSWGSGLAAGKKLEDARIPRHLPDSGVVRAEILDHYLEIEYLDSVLGRMLAVLDRHGLAENTIVVVTSDNGIALPRCKGTLYDMGTRVPFVVRWPAQVPPGRVVDDFVNLIDVGATFLDAGGVALPTGMTGQSLLDVLRSSESGRVDPSRNQVVLGIERHGYAREGGAGYPIRALRTHRWLYVRNYRPERWPAGAPDLQSEIHAERSGYLEVADTPTKMWMLDFKDSPQVRPFFRLAFEHRPPEELYDCRADPAQVANLAQVPRYSKEIAALRTRMEGYLRATQDPRVQGLEPWDGYDWNFNDWRASTFDEG